MNGEGMNEAQKEVLLQENEQLHDNIQRNLSDMYKLLSLGFPVLTGAFALAVEGKIFAAPDIGLLYALFSILTSLLIVSFNNIWMQLLTFTRYKYAEVLPRLYMLSGRSGDNYGQYTTRGGLLKTLSGAIIVQLMLIPMTAVAVFQVMFNYPNDVFVIPAYLSVSLAMLTTVVSWLVAREAVKVISASAPVDPSH